MALNPLDAAPSGTQPNTGVYIDQRTRNLHVPSGQAIIRETGSESYYNGFMVSEEVIGETVLATALTDGGSTVGTYVMASTIPAGALVSGVRASQIVGFAGDTSCTCKVGDGSTADRFCKSGGFSVFATAANGVEAMPVSGAQTILGGAAQAITLTFTSASDITSVIANALGSVAIRIFYRRSLA